ncbi:MAG: primase-like DNA-binding domain-containing protein, partial [Pseudomonadota bacterium]
DPLAEFLEACTRAESDARVQAGELYSAYEKFCEENATRAVTQTSFGRLLSGRNIERRRIGGRYFRVGIRLLDGMTTVTESGETVTNSGPSAGWEGDTDEF